MKKRSNKYRNIKVEIDGIKFASKKEGRRYLELKLLKQAGEIKDFKIQPKYKFELNGVKICTYLADFDVIHNDNSLIVEDVKSDATRKLPVYRIKKKLMKAFYNIDVKEI